jgi:thioredoxin-related protein
MRRFTALLLAPFLLAATVCAAAPEPVHSLSEALAKAKAENKLLFVQFGREACGNCQTLKSYLKSGSVRLEDCIYADLNCDDPTTNSAFARQFTVTGNVLPFVVVASPEGRQLAERTGYGKPKDFSDLLRAAEKTLKKP